MIFFESSFKNSSGVPSRVPFRVLPGISSGVLVDVFLVFMGFFSSGELFQGQYYVRMLRKVSPKFLWEFYSVVCSDIHLGVSPRDPSCVLEFFRKLFPHFEPLSFSWYNSWSYHRIVFLAKPQVDLLKMFQLELLDKLQVEQLEES